jgi:hypothetical protein
MWLGSLHLGSLSLYMSVRFTLSICLPRVWNIINLVFAMFTAILFVRNHRAIFNNSILNVVMNSFRLSFLSRQAVSSANMTVSRVEIQNRSLMYIKNKMGPKILPWMTEMLKICAVEILPFMSTCWTRSLR